MPKRDCKNRAAWKLEPGKGAARLSAHYKLDCDFGTPVVGIYKAGDSSDPIYLCDGHVGDVRPAEKRYSDVRLVQQVPGQLLVGAQKTQEAVLAKPHEDKPGSAPEAVALVPKPSLAKSGPTVVRAAVRPPARDLTFGNPAKALVDEAIWNLATGDYELYNAALRLGRSEAEAVLAAGGQMAMVHRKICEYAVKLETVLAASTAKIDAHAAVDESFERAITDVIGSAVLTDTEKDSAVAELGALQQGLSESIGRDQTREITPLDAHRLACAIAERANWGVDAPICDDLKAAYRAVYTGARAALRTAVPHANNLEERLANLYVARTELKKEPPLRKLQTLTA